MPQRLSEAWLYLAGTTQRTFGRDFLFASLLHIVLLIFVFRAPLFHGQTLAIGSAVTQVPQAITGMPEQSYQFVPLMYVQAKMIRDGVFPSWTPYTQAGTPLIGKQQGAIFAPVHLLFYLFPVRWMPVLMMLVLMLQTYAAFIFTYLLARCLGGRFLTAVCAGELFAFSARMLNDLLFATFGTGLFLPLLLLIVELYFRGFKKLSLYLMPWIVAFLFFAAHFESSFRFCLIAGAWFLFRIYKEPGLSGGAKIKETIVFGLASLCGVLMALVQVLPATQYVQNSYNHVWRSLPEFHWDYHTRGKYLSMEDVPLLLVGFGCLILSWVLIRKGVAAAANSIRTESMGKAETHRNVVANVFVKSVGWLLMGTTSLALGIASLANLGMDDSLFSLAYFGATPFSFSVTFFLLFTSFWLWAQPDVDMGIKTLGYIVIGSIAILLKTPVLANVLATLPAIKLMNNTVYPYELHLGLAVMGTMACQRLGSFWQERSWRDRLRSIVPVSLITCAIVAGYAASQPAKQWLRRLVPTGVVKVNEDQDGRMGGIMGPEYQSTFARRVTIAGWVPSFPPVTSAHVGLLSGQTVVSPIDVTGSLTSSGSRQYFHGTVPLEPPQNIHTVAVIRFADGSQRYLMGTLLDVRILENDRWFYMPLLAALAVLIGAFLVPPVAMKALSIAACVFGASMFQAARVAPDQIPIRLAGIQKIQEDKDLFRISSLDMEFLKADYANAYGLSDIRTGGDNLDVLTMIHFLHMTLGGFLSNMADSAALSAGLKLWGLANVKYLAQPPDQKLNSPDLELYYRGSDMSVWRNKQAMPRALFFDKHLVLPLGDWKDWRGRGRFLGPIIEMLRKGSLNINDTLLLHDPPSVVWSETAPQDGRLSTVRVDDYSPNRVRLTVDAVKPGFVFLSDNFFPGWKAYVNGTSEKILRAWITFRAVEVPAGRSLIEFVYNPFILRIPVLLTIGLALGWFVLYRRYMDERVPLRQMAMQVYVADTKKKKATFLQEPISFDIRECAVMAERAILLLVGSSALYWMIWSGFIYRGSRWTNVSAQILLAGIVGICVYDVLLKVIRKPSPFRVREG